jgi:deazaflavin-dependent oxidoreductase (nitroreductase family)
MWLDVPVDWDEAADRIREAYETIAGAPASRAGMRARTRLGFPRPFTTKVFNRFSRLFAGWLPGFGILVYRGRRSGLEYRTPMNVSRKGDEMVFALTYGTSVQWVKNIQAAGGCDLITRGRRLTLTEPRVTVDPERRLMPQPVRAFLGLMRVSEFMRMHITSEARAAT